MLSSLPGCNLEFPAGDVFTSALWLYLLSVLHMMQQPKNWTAQTKQTKPNKKSPQIKSNPAPQENHRECNDWFVFSAGLKAAMVQHKQWAAKDGIADPSLAHHYRHSRTVIFYISRTPLIQKTFKINLTLGTGLSFYEIHFQFLFFKEKKENHIAFYIQWIKLLIIRTAGFLGNKHPTLLC